MKPFFSILAVIFCIFKIYGEDYSISARRYSVPEGLANHHVKCFLQDTRGFMWIGTEEGLSRFDGYKFVNFGLDRGGEKGLKGIDIRSIVEGDNGNLWLATEKGIEVLNTRKMVFHHYSGNKSGLSGNSINSLCRFPGEKKIWIGSNEGISYYDMENRVFGKVVPVIKGKKTGAIDVKVLYADKRGNLWIGTRKQGVIKYNTFSGSFRGFHTNKGEGNRAIYSITEDRIDNLWIGTDLGLFKYSFNINLIHSVGGGKSLEDKHITSLRCDPEGKLWVGTKRNGLYRMDVWSLQSDKVVHEGLRDSDKYNRYEEIEEIYIDQNKNVWGGTEFRGFFLFNIGGKKFNHIKGVQNGDRGLTKNGVYSLLEDENGDLWVGTYRGLEVYNRDHNIKKVYYGEEADSLGNTTVRGLLIDSRDFLWIATAGDGIIRMDRSSGAIRRFRYEAGNRESISSNFSKSFLEDRKGRFWVATDDSGLNLFNRVKGNFRRIRFAKEHNDSRNKIYTIYEDPVEEDILWLGTFGAGLCRYDVKTGATTYYVHDPSDSKSLSNDSVIFIGSENRGTSLWIGTFGGGLSLFRKSEGKFESFTTSNGLRDNYVYSAIKDSSGDMWLSTNSGIARFNYLEKKFRYYSIEEGVQALEFNGGAFYRNSKGKIYMGGINGFNFFYPEDVVEDNTVPLVHATGVKVDQKVVSINQQVDGIEVLEEDIAFSKTINLTQRMKALEIEFSALHFTDPMKNEYAYKLLGFDHKWNYLGTKRSVTLHTLPGGEHGLLIKAANSDKVWSETPQLIKLRVKKGWFEKGIFRLLLNLLLIGFIVLGFLLRLKSLKSQNRLLEDKVTEKEQKLLELNRDLNLMESQIKDTVVLKRYGHLASVFVDKMDLPVEKIFSGLSYISEQFAETGKKIDKGEFSKQNFDNWFDLQKRSMEHLVISSGKAVLMLNSFGKMLIDYSKYREEVFDCAELIERCADKEQQEFSIKNIGIRISGDPSIYIKSYPLLVSEIISILLNNSLIHGFGHFNEGEVYIEYDYNEGFFRFTITDNGAGIPEINSKEVFEPLFTTRRTEGLQGVGLYILKNHVEIGLKGEVHMKSQPGRTVFKVEFPCQEG